MFFSCLLCWRLVSALFFFSFCVNKHYKKTGLKITCDSPFKHLQLAGVNTGQSVGKEPAGVLQPKLALTLAGHYALHTTFKKQLFGHQWINLGYNIMRKITLKAA